MLHAKPASAANPFPRIAVDSAPDELTANYFTASQAVAIERVRRFADLFASRAVHAGATFGVRGAVGSGKTHTVFRMHAELLELQPTTKFVYAKTLHARNILDFYRNVFPGSLARRDFLDLASQHYAALLRRRLGEEPDESTVRVALEQASRQAEQGDHQYLLKLLESDLIPSAGLAEAREDDLQRASEKLLPDLVRAFWKTSDPSYGQHAVDWLCGREIDEQQMRDIGVTTRIASMLEAQAALQFLFAAFRRADVPLMLVVDEIERTVLTKEGQPDAEGRSLVKDVAEAVHKGGHLFGASGVAQAWESLTPDVFGRIAHNDIVAIRISPPEVREIVYAWEGRTPSWFSDEALSLVAEASEGSARRLLEIAHHAWQASIGRGEPRVGPQHVREATRTALDDVGARARASQAIARLVLRADAVSMPSPVAGYDLALGSVGGGGHPLAFVKVLTSIFRNDEASDVRDLVDARRRAAKAHPGVPSCVVVAGYSSPDIAADLAQDGDVVVAFTQEDFDDRFGAFVRGLLARAAAGSQSHVDDRRLELLTQHMEEIKARSEQQIRSLHEALDKSQASRTQLVDDRFAASSAEKLAAAVERLTELLARESTAPGDDPALWTEQVELVRYAKFLDRVVPDSFAKAPLDRYERLLHEAHDPAIPRDVIYRERVEVLREIRAATLPRPVWRRAAAMLTLPALGAGLGGALVASSLVLAATTYRSEGTSLDAYRGEVARVRLYALQHRGVPTTALNPTEIAALIQSWTTVRSQAYDALKSTRDVDPSKRPKGESLDELLGDLSATALCASAKPDPAVASATATHCDAGPFGDSDELLRAVLASTDLELARLDTYPAFGYFCVRNLARSLLFQAGVVLAYAGIALGWMRRRRAARR